MRVAFYASAIIIFFLMNCTLGSLIVFKYLVVLNAHFVNYLYKPFGLIVNHEMRGIANLLGL